MERRQRAPIAELGGCVAIVFVAMLASSFANLEPTSMALKYNWVLKKLDTNVVMDPGVKIIGFWNSLVKYPKTLQKISYDNRHRDLLDGRTKDGLPLILGLSFQFQLLPEELYELYTQYESTWGNYLEVYKLMGIHILTEMATNYTAYQFFNDKQNISLQMKDNMDRYFQNHLHASVESLQINEDDLPGKFTDMILQAATMKQNISKTQKTLDARLVQMETAVKIAQAQVNVTIQQAIGQSARIEQNGRAEAAVITSFVESELEAYQKIKENLGLKGNDLLKYIWYDAVGGGSVIQPGNDFSVFSGVNPGAYMTESSR